MQKYRIITIDRATHDAIVPAKTIEAQDDDAAINVALQLPGANIIEVWEGPRCLIHFERNAR